ncbi:hypothetical protein SODALDRAFT_319380 [Sodiomyces alkalinus F11]|uniref:RRM domain-containing protein n=1 Tax=Sodiomyces alkalinus (strain CBS 110278 / VKM F-3762 / F11) TaxID=1314773 RepID=A0A3N2Q7T6_SODAK|nr:hypothetical protein SODALDRAFT_319380 [Sodiomyces alkalinus F11]ROT42776.1 hypothetical protein SODALDRAFT_319380 [Sodiomyces alkalinus F11]
MPFMPCLAALLGCSSTLRRLHLYEDTLPSSTKLRANPFALLRRAQFSASRLISVPQLEYEQLKKVARQYANLKENLINGGVTLATIDLLSCDDSTWGQPQALAAASNTADKEHVAVDNDTQPAYLDRGQNFQQDGQYLEGSPPTVVAKQQGEARYSRYQSHPHQCWPDPNAEPSQDNGSLEMGTPGFTGQGAGFPPRTQYERIATRTLLLCNLPEGTTHADITSVVRGGQLLDIFLRAHDRSAQVSFLNSADAKAFYDHVRRHDLYIRHKRVDIRWSERQYILPPHVAHKISAGATRNLVVRRCDPKHTEENLRDDLEHIHNLVVIRVTFVGSSCFISTNSVNNAMFARTCMMSRLKYKGSKIEWDSDECAQPIPAARPKPRTQPAPAKQGLNPLANRFQLLGLDDDSDDEDEDGVALGFRTPSSVDIAA